MNTSNMQVEGPFLLSESLDLLEWMDFETWANTDASGRSTKHKSPIAERLLPTIIVDAAYRQQAAKFEAARILAFISDIPEPENARRSMIPLLLATTVIALVLIGWLSGAVNHPL